ncbi:MAG: SusC/RagA family TonB-linked outer membrane protein [Phocaeicola sp.]
MNLHVRKTVLLAALCTSIGVGSKTQLWAHSAHAIDAVQQNQKLTGVVVDSQGEAIIGANVLLKGTTHGTITDIDGNFLLEVAQGAIIEISFIGYSSQEVKYNGQSTLRIVLQDDTESLDEVVVVGYGVMRKSDLTGSVGKLDVKELKKVSTLDATQAMQGRMAGVTVISNSGSPGAGATVRVRGVGTINNSDPLYVVDGFPCSDISHVAPTDIESMEVLKDASATAIYGSRGANGVVLVKTKSGAKNQKVEVQANAFLGIAQVAKKLDMADATQFAQARKAVGSMDDRLNYILESQQNGNYLKGTDWQDEIMRTALSQRYNVSVQGASSGYSYSHGVTYSDEQGIVKGSEMQKFMFHTNNNYNLTKKVKLGMNLNYVWYKKPGLDGNDFYRSVLPGTLRSDPVSAAWDDYTDFYGQVYYSSAQTNPALGIWQNGYTNTMEHRFLANFFLQIDDLFIKGLSFRSQFGKTLTFNEYREFRPAYYITASQKNDEQTLNQIRNNGDTWSNTNYFSYNGSFGKLNMGSTLGMEVQANTWSDLDVTAYGVPEDADLQYIGAHKDNSKFIMNGAKSQNRLASGFFRTNLSWDNKYLVTGTVRLDGSSRFTRQNRWGWFPSFSGGWNVANEAFMEPIREVLPVFKVRAGWGLVGNQDSAGDFDYVSSVVNGYSYVFDKNIATGSVQEQLANEELTWESSEQFNIGVDYGFFDNKLNGSIDFFVRKTKDMILSRPIPNYAGKRRPSVNAGSMENKGVEFSISYQDKVGELDYGVSFNATWIKNRVTSLAGGDPIRDGSVGRIGNTTMTEEGREIAYFYGYKTAGIFKTQADLDSYVASNGTQIVGPGGVRPQLGDVAFVDRNDDGKISEEDMTYLGSAIPTLTGGFNLNLGYKNVDFTLFMNYSLGNEIVNSMYQSLYSTDMFETNISRDMALNHWSVENPNADLPRLALTDSNLNGTSFSDRMVEDGSYLRIKQIQVGYTFPQSLTKKIGVNSLRVYGAVDNLLTITSYSGLDPEVFGLYGNPLYSGIDMVNYPQPRTFSFGLNVNF